MTYALFIRGDSSLENLPQPFHLQLTHGTLSLRPSLLFIRPWTNQRPGPRPKAQYIILGPYPYMSLEFIVVLEFLISINFPTRMFLTTNLGPNLSYSTHFQTYSLVSIVSKLISKLTSRVS